MSETNTATLEPETTSAPQRAEKKPQPKQAPKYQVILWDDQFHTFEYVIQMMQKLFHVPRERGMQIAKEVDTVGRAICLTTTKEHAELKRDQIHAYGSDPNSFAGRSKGSMWSTIEACS